MPRTSPSPSRTTDAQAEALAAMRSCLLCQLCDRPMTEPATLLACAHSFCHDCILKHTENSWTCPLMGCGTPVTMKGGSSEYIKKNHLISAVAASVQNIERIIANGPANWWVGQKGNEQNRSEAPFDDDDEVVDFQMMMDRDGDKRKREEGNASQEKKYDGDDEDDASSTTKEYIIDEQQQGIASNAWAESGGRQTMSIDQSLFPAEDAGAKFDRQCAAPPDLSCSTIAVESSQPEPKNCREKDDERTNPASAKFDQRCAAPPDFSCSPIAFKSSQPEPNCREEDGKRTNPASAAVKPGRVVRPYAQSGNENSANVKLLDEVPGKRSPSNKKRRTSIFTPPSEGTSAKFDQQCAAPPNFSCSPIAMQCSQPEPTYREEDGKQTNPASASAKLAKHGRVLKPIAQNSNKNSANIQFDEKRPTSILTSPDRSSLGQKPPAERKSGRARVSFQQQPRVMLLDPSWTLSNAHTRCLRKCAAEGSIAMLQMSPNDDQFDPGIDFDTREGRELFLTTLSSDRTSNLPPAPMFFYAVSAERDESFSFGDEAIIVPRSFPYYLAVACGLPIVDIAFLSSAAQRRRRGATERPRYLFPSPPRADGNQREGTRRNGRKLYRVLGASDYSWGAPEKARAAAVKRHSLWQNEEGPHTRADALPPGTDLLRGRGVVLLGDFDPPHRSKRAAAKRTKLRDAETNGGGYCTRGNVGLLLQLCGADVYDVDSVATAKNIKKGLSAEHWADIRRAKPLAAPKNGQPLDEALQASAERGSGNNHIVVMVKDKSDLKLGSDFLHQFSSVAKVEVSQIPILTCQWLLDSIGEFEVKDMSEYTIQDR